MTVIVTGGAGFIGSAFVRYLVLEKKMKVINVDKLTYAGNLESLSAVSQDPLYIFENVDVCESDRLKAVFDKYQPDAVIHLAAESHVDRSIDGPSAFIETNIVGTYTLLEVSRQYWRGLPPNRRETFRLHHVSTDEVYGDLGESGVFFTESTPYAPSSPYSASKASSDHLVRAWHRTYGLPVVLTSCSNNYGPYHFPEKLIPLMILNGLEGKPLPVYGCGDQVRDWLYVEDHARALFEVLTRGRIGETYNIGGRNEKCNLEVVEMLCDLLQDLAPNSQQQYRQLITFVQDRPGHDLRYAIDASKIERELGWVPQETFETGLRKTVEWYLANQAWCSRVQDGSYRRERLGSVTT